VTIGKRVLRFVIWFGVAIAQVLMTQFVAYLVSLLFPGLEEIPPDRAVLFALAIVLSYIAAIYLTGWAALLVGWVTTPPFYLARFIWTVVGVLVPFGVAALLGRLTEPGVQILIASIVAGIVGFYLPGWVWPARD
jgi:hypothetical protein